MMGNDNLIELMQHSKEKAFSGTEARAEQYETPLVTVDIVVFTVDAGGLKVLLIQRKDAPYEHMWAIPGGFIHQGETLEEAASRRLREETSIEQIFLEQLYTFGNPTRDPRARVITVSYYALVSREKIHLEAQANAEDIGWFNTNGLPDLAFDHESIVRHALNRLKERLETDPIAFQLLPDKFSLTELQRVYELILSKTLDKRNFRKKILASGIITDLGETKMEGYHRPAQLYAFNKQHTAAVNNLF